MATITFNQNRKNILLAVARGNFYMNNVGGKTSWSAVEWLESNGYIDMKPIARDGYLYFVTAKGNEWLDANMPMIDQPQPPSEIETVAVYVPQVGDTVEYPGLDGKREIGTITDIVERSMYGNIKIATPTGKIVDRHAKDIRHNPAPMLPDVDTLPGRDYAEVLQDDDLPFTVIGNDPDDTQELPTVKVEAEMSLSQLVDAALDPNNSEAFETLKAYDLTNVPLWVLEIERNDLADLKWALWSECRKINAGTLMSNPDYVAKQIEVNRAFQVCDILHKEVVNRKAVGFNVLE